MPSFFFTARHFFKSSRVVPADASEFAYTGLVIRRIVLTFAIGVIAVGASAQWSNPGDDIPAYHATPPSAGTTLPPLLTPEQIKAQNFTVAWQAKIYADAAHVQKVLYQLPCFCRCDKALGHASLHSCFEGTHGAVCSTCAKEGYYAYLMTKQGKTVKQIREGILHKEYESIDLQTIS